MTLSGLPAVAVVLLLSALSCVPVWFASRWLRDRLLERVERRYERKLAELQDAQDAALVASRWATEDPSERRTLEELAASLGLELDEEDDDA